MTIDQKRIKVAEVCKWTDLEAPSPSGRTYGRPPVGSPFVIFCDRTAWVNFDSDLNSAHEMEKVLTPEQLQRYYIKLAIIVGNKELANHNTARVACADAPQRFEAFGLTLGLWKDGE